MHPQTKAEKVRVTCLRCDGSSLINILDDQHIMYIDHTPIISSRFRGDLNWGFECECGNSSLLAREERNDVDILVQASDVNFKRTVIERLVASLKVKDNEKFKMVGA